MEIVSGTFALWAPLTLICSCTVWPTSGCESLNTAVTLGDAAKAVDANVETISAKPILKSFRSIDISYLSAGGLLPARLGLTSHYRHGVSPCVHQAARVVPRPSLI